MDGGQLRQLEAWTKQGRLRYDVVAAARNGVVDTAAIARAITATHSNHIVAKLPQRRYDTAGGWSSLERVKYSPP